jgi:hypothetical protein
MEVNETKEITVLTVNETRTKGTRVCDIKKDPLDSEPRWPSKIYELPPDVRPKTPWGLPISLFKDYKFDNEAHLADCFEFDWSCSKILRVVKNPEEQRRVKAFLKENHQSIRECYKYYAAVGCSGGIFSVGVNAFTDLCSSCRIIDG